MLNTRILTTPIDRVRNLDRVFESALSGRGGRVWIPAMDVAERRDSYVVQTELPGVALEHLDVHLEHNVLTISGSKVSEYASASPDEVRLLASERAHGDFTRSVRLPDGTSADEVVANFADGVLTVTVPKAKTAQPRKIEVASNRISPATNG